jgi:integrase
MEKHPLTKLKRFDATPKTVRRAITPDEITRLLEAVPEYRRILYETAFCSGLRAKELKSLTVRDLDLERGGLCLHAKWTKNRMAGFQPLPSFVLEHLRDFAESGQALALYQRNYIRRDTHEEYPEEPLLYVPSNTSRMIERDLKAAGIPKWTEEGKVDFHALRVSYVSLVVETGADLKAAQTLARHTTPELTMNVYARVRGSKLTEVAEAVGRLILPLTNIELAQQHRALRATSCPATGYEGSRSASIPAASTIT